VKKIWLLALVASACTHTTVPGSALTGAPTPRLAAEGFLNAARAGDLQAMSTFWGDENGPARDHLDRQDLDQRLVLLQQCYKHDQFHLTEESVGSTADRRVFHVQLFRGTRSKSPTFTMVRGPSNRWYVQNADYPAMGDFCAGK
jgi:hypothetical protein